MTPDAWGVNIKPPQTGTSYVDPGVLFTNICASGASWVRDNMVFTSGAWPLQLEVWRRLAEIGIEVQVIAGKPSMATSERPRIVSQLREAAPYLTRVEGWNEPDIAKVSDIASHQRFLWDTVHTTASLGHVEVVAPSLMIGPGVSDTDARNRLATLYGAIKGWFDHANLHVYPGGNHPSADYLLDKRLSQMPATGKPIIVTEGGYVTAPSSGAAVYSEADQAKWLADYVQQTRARNLRFSVYELIDNVGYFGLFTAAGRPKPAVRALRALR